MVAVMSAELRDGFADVIQPYYDRYGITVRHGDCLEVLASLPDNSVHSVCTDPPYSLGFMGREWDTHGEHEDAGFAYWLAGFIDGEGCFRVQRHERGTFTCTFSIKVRRDERGTLEAIKRFLGGVGTIRDGEGTGNAHPQSTYAIQDKAGCARLIQILDKYPLRAKKRLDYEPWAEAVVEWNTMRRGHRWSGRADWSRMESLKARVEGARRYVDPPWSGHEHQDWCRLWARECLRVLKPGGHLLAFGGTRTWHRLAVAIEDAGFEIRDSIAWLYGSGFPKSMDVSKAIDKAAGATREVVGSKLGQPGYSLAPSTGGNLYEGSFGGTGDPIKESQITAPATPEAEQWQGWGTALKPAHEPVVHGVKPAGDKAILSTIGSQLESLERLCKQRVSSAVESSARIRADSSAAKVDSALASAATQPGEEAVPRTEIGAAADSSGRMAMSVSGWTAETFLSTVMSWKHCWAELSTHGSTSTTSTTTSRTTDLRTLSSLLSMITQNVTAQSILEPDSWSSLASAADNLFAAGVLSLRSILALSAHETATGSTPHRRPDELGSSPAFEPIVVARKPILGTVAANVLAHGTGALNIAACRIATTDDLNGGAYSAGGRFRPMDGDTRSGAALGMYQAGRSAAGEYEQPTGRWPTNVVLTHAATPDGVDLCVDGCVPGCLVRELDEQTIGTRASRFFPVFRFEAKAPTAQRPRVDGVAHPTVKPLALMRWLTRLVTPSGGVVLDPFLGSGTTAQAARAEGLRCVGIEREETYLPLIRVRLDGDGDDLFGGLFDHEGDR